MSYTHAYEKVHWSLVDLPGLPFGRGRGTILEGYDSGYVKILSSPLSHQLSITFQLELGHMTCFPFRTRMLTGLTLCYSCKGQLQLLWVLRAVVLSKPEDSVLLCISQDYGSYSFFLPPFLQLSLGLRWKARNQTWVTCEKDSKKKLHRKIAIVPKY